MLKGTSFTTSAGVRHPLCHQGFDVDHHGIHPSGVIEPLNEPDTAGKACPRTAAGSTSAKTWSGLPKQLLFKSVFQQRYWH